MPVRRHHAGGEGAPYHLELTRRCGNRAGSAQTADNLSVLYLSDRDTREAAVARMDDAGFEPVTVLNLYWDAIPLTTACFTRPCITPA
jgi:hypothetical protein